MKLNQLVETIRRFDKLDNETQAILLSIEDSVMVKEFTDDEIGGAIKFLLGTEVKNKNELLNKLFSSFNGDRKDLL